jgi:hypothetical protein
MSFDLSRLRFWNVKYLKYGGGKGNALESCSGSMVVDAGLKKAKDNSLDMTEKADLRQSSETLKEQFV